MFHSPNAEIFSVCYAILFKWVWTSGLVRNSENSNHFFQIVRKIVKIVKKVKIVNLVTKSEPCINLQQEAAFESLGASWLVFNAQ